MVGVATKKDRKFYEAHMEGDGTLHTHFLDVGLSLKNADMVCKYIGRQARYGTDVYDKSYK
jgi:hypothetical protein